MRRRVAETFIIEGRSRYAQVRGMYAKLKNVYRFEASGSVKAAAHLQRDVFISGRAAAIEKSIRATLENRLTYALPEIW